MIIAILGSVILGGLFAGSALAAEPSFEGVNPLKPMPISFSGGWTSVETSVREIGGCGKFSGSGALTGARSGHAVLKLEECGNLPNFCHDVGNPNTLTTVELEIVPVYINKATHAVGLWFKPKTGTQFAKLGCSVGTGEIKGGLITEPLGVKGGRSFLLEFRGHEGHQFPEQFETETGVKVGSWLENTHSTTGGWSKESWNSKPTMTTEREIRIVG
jgi:hypothetical protein